jgi:hypothetical protein
MSDVASFGQRPLRVPLGQGLRVSGPPPPLSRLTSWDYLLRNGHQSVPPEPLSVETWVVWAEVEPDQELARAEFAEAVTAVSTTTMAKASLVVRCLGATESLLLSDPNAQIGAH